MGALDGKKVLIIGAQGMLGHYLADVFEGAICWGREELNIIDSQAVMVKMRSLKPDVIINAAAYNDVDGAEGEEGFGAAIKVNGLALSFLAVIAKRIGATFVHFSTDYVFDGTNQKGYREEDRPNPINSYGYSKWLGENLVRAIGGRFYLMRVSRLFGCKGFSPSSKASFVDKMLEAARKNSEVRVIDEEFSSPTYALDVAKKAKEIIEDQLPFGVYHVVNSGGCTWYQFAKRIFEIKGIDVKMNRCSRKDFPARAERPQFSQLLMTKIKPLRYWEEALEEFILCGH